MAVNYAGNQSRVPRAAPFPGLAGSRWHLQDQMTPASYDWNGDDLESRGLFLDMSPWQAAVLAITRRS